MFAPVTGKDNLLAGVLSEYSNGEEDDPTCEVIVEMWDAFLKLICIILSTIGFVLLVAVIFFKEFTPYAGGTFFLSMLAMHLYYKNKRSPADNTSENGAAEEWINIGAKNIHVI